MSKGKFAVGALVAAAAGFVAGILTAPKSGKETREDLKYAALKAKDTVVAEAEKAKDVAVKKSKEAQGKAEEVYKDVRGKAEDVAGDVVEKATDLKDRTAQAVEGAKKGFKKNPKAKK